MRAMGVYPELVSWSPRWMAPRLEVTCPGCGRRAERSASNWSDNTLTGLRATVSCEPIGQPVTTCWQTFEVLLPIEALAAA